MSVFHQYNSYCLKKPKLINKNYLAINAQEVHLLSVEHKRSNTEMNNESPLHYIKQSNINKSLFQNTQITKERSKEKVYRIIHNLFYPNKYKQIKYSDEDKSKNLNSKRIILQDILTLDTSEIKMKSFEFDGVGIGKIDNKNKILDDINEYEATKKYAKVLAKSNLNNKAASIEWMFNFVKEKPMRFNKNNFSSHNSFQKLT